MTLKLFRTRFAPSPTGWLHQGHVFHGIWLTGIAQIAGAEVLLRIEDHDRQRCKKSLEKHLIDDLSWLEFFPGGFEPSVERNPLFFRQSERGEHYEKILRRMLLEGKAYRCSCSRNAIRQRAGLCRGQNYDGFCWFNPPNQNQACCVRFRNTTCDSDASPSSKGFGSGDFPLQDRRGNFTYQFCVVLDDLDQGVNLIIRGLDLIHTIRGQKALARAMVQAYQEPLYWHHPLLMAEDGQRKLSKSEGAQSVRSLRERGFSPAQVRGLVLCKAGVIDRPEPIAIDRLAELIAPGLPVDLLFALRSGQGLQ